MKINGARKSLVISFAQTYTSLLFNILTVMIVSRLLTPTQIGVYSVAAALTALVQMLRDFGVSEYLVQEKHLDEEAIRTAFTINVIIAWILACVLFALSTLISKFYGNPGIGQVVRVLSGTFILLPFGTNALSRMRRDMAFGTIFKIRLGEIVVRSSLTIGLAFAGFSYMSMAWGSLAAMLAWVLGCAVWGWDYRVRGLSLSQWKRIVPFSLNRTSADIVIQLGRQSSDIVIGKTLGMSAAGLYSRGYGIVNLFREKVVDAINTVAFPLFAREHRERDAAPELFIRSLVYLTGISWPFFGFAMLMASPLIQLLFGNQWDAAVPVMRWLCGAAILGTLVFQCNEFFTAIGRVGAVTSVEIQYQLIRVGLVIVTAFYSIEAVAASQIIVYVIAAILYYRKLTRYESLTITKLVRALLPSAVVMVTTCIVPAIIFLWPGFISTHSIPALAIAGVGAGLGWLGGLMLTRHPLMNEIRRSILKLRRRD